MTLPHALTAKQQEWLAHLEQAQQQNLSLQEYARRTGIKASSLYAARKQMCKARSQTATASVSFAEVRMAGAGPAAVCVMYLAPGIRLKLSALPSPQWLAAVCAQWSQRS